jgi:two-component system, NarL family, response regulator DesR
MIDVLVAQDATLFRGAIAALVQSEADMEVVAEVSTGSDILPAVRATRPDVTVLDLAVLRRDDGGGAGGEAGPDDDPVRAAMCLCRAAPRCRVLMVLETRRADLLAMADETVLGSVGFVTRNATPQHLLSAVRSLAHGQPVIDPELVHSVLTAPGNPLTARERSILAHAAEGAGAREIAARLFLAPGTVRNCLSRINVKTGARNRIQAIARARKAGWI